MLLIRQKADREIKRQAAKINGMDTSKKKIQFIYHTGAYYTMSKANCNRYGTFEGKSISSVKFVYAKILKTIKQATGQDFAHVIGQIFK